MVKIVGFFFKEGRIKTAIMISLILLVTAGCLDKKNKQKLFSKKLICNKLWREMYRVYSGGAYSAEVYSDYLTDSTNFRLYVGTNDEYSSFDYQCRGDSVIVRKFSHNENQTKTIVKVSTFSLSKLRLDHIFE